MKKIILSGMLILSVCAGCADSDYKESTVPDTTTATTEIITATQTTALTTALPPETTTKPETTTQPETQPPTVPPEDLNNGRLVKITDYIPDAVIDLRYATTNNFTGTILYDDPEAYLCFGTVKKLREVQKELKEYGYRILIWDAYRSPEAQQKLWEVYPDPNFVADPRNGLTSHSRGGTIDISMVTLDGAPVEMPSAFDEFSAVADRDYSDVSATAGANATLLEEVMTKNGFTGYRGEWWDYSDTERYDLEPYQKPASSDTGDNYLTEYLNINNYSYSDIENSQQIIVIDSEGKDCSAYCYEKNNNQWENFLTTAGVIGKNGTAGEKHEGDYFTPKGIYPLGFGFGTEFLDTIIDYRLINDNCYWVDDPHSIYYNQWIESDEIKWESAEHLSDYPSSYHYAVVIEYNTDPIVYGEGSAIFLHCQSGEYTAGCVALPENDIIDIMQWLDPEKSPVIIIS